MTAEEIWNSNKFNNELSYGLTESLCFEADKSVTTVEICWNKAVERVRLMHPADGKIFDLLARYLSGEIGREPADLDTVGMNRYWDFKQLTIAEMNRIHAEEGK